MAPNQAPPDRILGRPVERVGVILVHGIGEQRRFEHLESECRKIIDAIIANFGRRRRDVTLTLRTGTGDAFQGNQSTWVSGPDAPLHALVELQERVVDIAFHEVWWADVNESLTLGKQVRFWLWGLSLSGIATNNVSFLPGSGKIRPPARAGELTLWNRFRMAYIAILFGLSAFSIAFVNMILKRLDSAPLISTGVIVNYLSGVKLFNQTTRSGGSPMDGPDEPPRVAMRRRMIRAIVDVATGPCDRWYILAHSLGTIVAWNGLMEIEEALPNYLSLDQWAQLGSSPLSARSPVPLDVNAMMPNRPVWLGRREIIDRIALFEKFRGLVTYGSPLERFCALWSNAVGINRDEFPFQAGVEWINVYRSGRDLDQRLRSARSAAKRACGSQAAQFPLSRIMARFVQSHSLPPGPTRAASPAGRRRQALAGQPDRGLAGARREPGVAARRGAEGRIDVLDAAQARRIGARLAGLSAGPLAHPAVDSCRLRADGAGVAVAPLRDLPSHERHSVVAKLSALLIEAACLWAAIGTVVVITSGIHYVFASRDLQDLKKRFEDQRQMRQPDDFQEASARKT